MSMEFKEPRELVGKYIAKTWNGMSDFFKVVGSTNKCIVLQELEYTVCPGGKDPVHNNTRIVFKNGKPVSKQERDYSDPKRNKYAPIPPLTDKKPILKRVEYDGTGLCIKAAGGYRWRVIALDDKEAEAYREQMYWG